METQIILNSLYKKILKLIAQDAPSESIGDYTSAINLFRDMRDIDLKKLSTQNLWNDCKSTINYARKRAGMNC